MSILIFTMINKQHLLFHFFFFQFTSSEAVLAAILDSFPRLRKRRMFVTGLVCMVGFLFGLAFCFQVL